MTLDGDTSEAAFFPCYTMTWIAIIISRLCVILARWQVFTHAQELKLAHKDSDTFPDASSQIQSANDTPRSGFVTAGAVCFGHCSKFLWRQETEAPSPATPHLTLSKPLTLSLLSEAGIKAVLPLLGGIANTNECNQALKMFRWEVLLQSYVSGEICFQLQWASEQAQTPQYSAAMDCILPLCYPRPILIIWHGQPARDLIPRSNLGGNGQLTALFTRRSALGAASRAMQLMGREDMHLPSTQSPAKQVPAQGVASTLLTPPGPGTSSSPASLTGMARGWHRADPMALGPPLVNKGRTWVEDASTDTQI